MLPSRPAADDEVGRVTIGVPGLSAQIPVRHSLLATARRLFARQPSHELVQAPWLRSHVYISADDDGTADFYLSVVNMHRKPATIERLYLDSFLVNGHSVNAAPPYFTPPRQPVTPYGIAEVHFRMVLGAPAIRDLLGAIQRAQNSYSSPGVEISVRGMLDVRLGKNATRIGFATEDRRPELRLSCPAAQKAHGA